MINKLRSDIKSAMIEKRNTGNTNRYITLKNILEKAQKEAKEKRQEDNITDSMVINAVKKEIKQLNDLLQYCKEGTDKFNDTKECLSVAEALLPKMASDVEIFRCLKNHKDDVTSIGAGMKILKAEFGENMDGKRASILVNDFIFLSPAKKENTDV